MIPCDLHVHPDYSIDAGSSIEQYCRKAGQIGLQVLGFTTHYDINPTREDVDPFMQVDGERVRADDYALGRYFDDCLEARRQFPDLRILIGLEVDYFIGVEAEVHRLKTEFPFDYMIGSVHCLEGVAISSRGEAADYFNVHSMEKMADGYFDLLYSLAAGGLFDVIGHADYYLRYGLLYYGDGLLSVYKNRLDRVVEAAVRTNTGFEINASQSRHGNDSFYPHLDFIKSAVELGAEVNSIGTDSHNADKLGLNIIESLEILKRNNITFRPFYEKR